MPGQPSSSNGRRLIVVHSPQVHSTLSPIYIPGQTNEESNQAEYASQESLLGVANSNFTNFWSTNSIPYLLICILKKNDTAFPI